MLIAEVVSPEKENRERDYEHKRSRYAQIGVLEYWLIDPETEMVTILALEKGEYQAVGEFMGKPLSLPRSLPSA